MDKQHFTQLLDRYLNGTASESEKGLLDEYFTRLQEHDPEELQQLLQNPALRQSMLDNILTRTHPVEKPRVVNLPSRFKWRFTAAAAACIAIVAGIYLMVDHRPAKAPPPAPHLAASPVPLLPGSNKAVLTLSDGRQVQLDSSAILALTDQGSKLSLTNNRLSYNATPATVAASSYNTLSTPKGGQYQLTLSDGTRVWLNAASSIRYPVSFNGDKRIVELKGEGYFEVAQNNAKPFFVKTEKMQVEVLGTHFNVMAYEDEAAVATTLLEGAVRLDGNGLQAVLKPGEQGRMRPDNDGFNISLCDIEKVMAWKDGLFRFKGDDIQTIMRQLKRWYDVDVTFAGRVSAKKYSGTISKYVEAREVFKILSLAGITFKQEGKTIIVSQSPT